VTIRMLADGAGATMAAPSLDVWRTYRVAHAYQARRHGGVDTDDLDMWLGFAPWQSDEAAARYALAVDSGWVAPASIDYDASAVVVAAAAIPDGLIDTVRAASPRARQRLVSEALDKMPQTVDRVLVEDLLRTFVGEGDRSISGVPRLRWEGDTPRARRGLPPPAKGRPALGGSMARAGREAPLWYGRTFVQARDRLRAAIRTSGEGLEPQRTTATVNEWMQEWLALYVNPRLRPRTVESYEGAARNYIRPTVGSIRLAKLRPEDVARMLRALESRGDLSTTTVRYAWVVLRAALNRAVKSGRVTRNVAALTDPPRKSRHDRQVLGANEVTAFLESVRGHPEEALFVLAYATGARLGELLALSWGDVDFERRTISVRHTLHTPTRTIAPPKTASSYREIVLGASVMAVIHEHRVRQLSVRLAAGATWQDGDFLFTTAAGRPLDGRAVTRSFQAALKRAGMPRQRFHDARHSVATLLIERGEELAVVSKLLGHSSIATTADVYAHLTRGMSARIAETLDPIVARRTG
jgi:integrase